MNKWAFQRFQVDENYPDERPFYIAKVVSKTVLVCLFCKIRVRLRNLNLSWHPSELVLIKPEAPGLGPRYPCGAGSSTNILHTERQGEHGTEDKGCRTASNTFSCAESKSLPPPRQEHMKFQLCCTLHINSSFRLEKKEIFFVCSPSRAILLTKQLLPLPWMRLHLDSR